MTFSHGPSHTDTLIAKMNLANSVGSGSAAEALPLFEEAAVGLTEQLGPAHPHAQMAVENATGCRRALGLPATAALAPAAARFIANNRAPAEAAAAATVVVVLKGLVGAAQHNGKRAAVLGFLEDRDRFELHLESDGNTLNVKPANIEVVAVPVGLAVGVGGLVGAVQHNGMRGTVVGGLDPKTGRYTVRLDSSDDNGGGGVRPLGLKPGNLRLLEEQEKATCS
eukprot:SAG22_NODE_912_length_6534_cov_2.967211_2_plen_224_part_00